MKTNVKRMNTNIQRIRILAKVRSDSLKFACLLAFFFLFVGQPKAVKAAASLSLSPAAQTVEVGQNFDVTVQLNSGGANTDATDVILNYDATKLTLVTAALGDLYENRLVTNVSVSGKVTLRASSTPGSYFSGTGTFATLSFKGKNQGLAAANFDFSANSTTDCNVAYAGSDILGSVTNGSYTIAAAGTLNLTPTTTGNSPTSRPTQPVSGGLTPTVTLGIFGTFFMILGALAILF